MKLLFACLVLLAAASFTSVQGGYSWYNCGFYNPCGKSSTLFYYPSYYPQYFIQCGLTAEQCYYVLCRSGTIWNQAALTCVFDPAVPPPAPVRPVRPNTPYIPGFFNCESKNPCTPENAAQNRFYFSHDVSGKYVQCDNFQKCFTRECPAGEVWDAWGYTCSKPVST